MRNILGFFHFTVHKWRSYLPKGPSPWVLNSVWSAPVGADSTYKCIKVKYKWSNVVSFVVSFANNVKIDLIGLKYSIHLPSGVQLFIGQSEHTQALQTPPVNSMTDWQV